jgi:hypothetical protein
MSFTYTIIETGYTSNQITINGLSTGVTYTFIIESMNSYYYSYTSTPIQIVCATVPSTPSAPVTSNNANNVIVRWVAPNSNGMQITSYVI